MSDPLVKWGPLITATSGWVSSHDEVDAKSDCIQELAAALRTSQARVAELEEVERKAIEQSEYIQSHGLTEYEMASLQARVAELESHIAATGPWKETKP